MLSFETFLVLTALLIGLVALGFWASMLVHCFKNEKLTPESRILWLVVLVLGKLLAACAYYVVRFRQRLSVAA